MPTRNQNGQQQWGKNHQNEQRIKQGDIVIVMGVCGVGKSTVAQALSDTLSNYEYYEGDSFHSIDNVNKMERGMALTDEDRIPWILSISNHMNQFRNGHLIYTCSALKQEYRDVLMNNYQHRQLFQIHFVYLYAGYDEIFARLQGRSNHFMKPNMLQSQFQDLQPPLKSETIHIHSMQPVSKIVDQIVTHFI